MNVLIVAMFSTEGGISKEFVEIAKNLANKCNVYSVINDTNIDIFVPNEKGRLILSIGKNNVCGFFDIRNYIRLRKFAKENKIDCAYFYSHTPFNLGAVRFLKNIRIFAFLHNPIPHIGTGKIKGIFEYAVNKYITKKAERVFVASEFQKKELNSNSFYKKYHEKISCQYLPLQTSMLYELPEEEKTIDVLFFGRLEYYKGLDVLAEAMRKLPNVKCVVIGKGKIDIDFPENVQLINRYVPDEEISRYINRSKIGCLPYREATGTNIVQVFNYYSVPVIATRTGCFPEYIKDSETGVIIEPENIDELVNAIYNLIDDCALAAKLGQNARKELKRFDNEALSQMLLNYFQETSCEE